MTGSIKSWEKPSFGCSKNQVIQMLDLLPLQIRSSAVRGTNDVIGLALRFNLSFYDVTYLDLALETASGFATLDKKLNEVAKELGLKTV